MGKQTAGIEVPLRIIVERPPPDVLFCVQGKPGEHFSVTRSIDADLAFDVVVRVADGDPPRLLGNVVQGPSARRFLYICSGTYAGETGTHWGRRAKIPLWGITRTHIAQAKLGARLTASITGTSRDGGPVCASVPLLGVGWQWKT